MLAALGLMIGLATADRAVAGTILPVKDDLARGREKYLAGEFDEALSDFESALVQDPEDPVVTLAVGETLFRLERYEEALAEFERTLSLTDDKELKAEALYNAGTTLLAAGDPGKAAEKLLGSLAVDDSQGDALYNLEVALRRLQEQQQEQQEQQEQQDQQDQEQDEQEKDEEEKQDEQEQEQQDQQEQEQKEQEQQEQQERGQQEQSDQPEDQQDPTEPDPEELTQEQALQILKALDRDEEELKRSVQKRLKGGTPKSGKKW